ncbi:MAG: membrane protein insertion efficiency factor YidD [Clostridia bacterium]
MKKILIAIIKFYKKNISSMKPFPTCRFSPTCSDYGLQAIEEHGAFKGGMLTLWRVLRCNPFCKAGYDPVPKKKK